MKGIPEVLSNDLDMLTAHGPHNRFPILEAMSLLHQIPTITCNNVKIPSTQVALLHCQSEISFVLQNLAERNFLYRLTKSIMFDRNACLPSK